MSSIYIPNHVFEDLSKRLDSIESKLKEIHKEKAHKQFGLLTTLEAAKALQITTRHLQNLRDRGDIGFVQFGRVVRYRPEDIQAYIDEFYVSPGKMKGYLS